MNKIIGIILICLCILIHFLITRHYDKEKELKKNEQDNDGSKNNSKK